MPRWCILNSRRTVEQYSTVAAHTPYGHYAAKITNYGEKWWEQDFSGHIEPRESLTTRVALSGAIRLYLVTECDEIRDKYIVECVVIAEGIEQS